MPLRDSETGKVMSEREACMYAITDRIHQIEQRGREEEKSARVIPLCSLRHEFEVISDKFEKENRHRTAAGEKPREETTLRPEFVRAVHKVEDEMTKNPRPYERSVSRNELREFDKMLEAIHAHYERDIQKERLAQQQRDAGEERERSR